MERTTTMDTFRLIMKEELGENGTAGDHLIFLLRRYYVELAAFATDG